MFSPAQLEAQNMLMNKPIQQSSTKSKVFKALGLTAAAITGSVLFSSTTVTPANTTAALQATTDANENTAIVNVKEFSNAFYEKLQPKETLQNCFLGKDIYDPFHGFYEARECLFHKLNDMEHNMHKDNYFHHITQEFQVLENQEQVQKCAHESWEAMQHGEDAWKVLEHCIHVTRNDVKKHMVEMMHWEDHLDERVLFDCIDHKYDTLTTTAAATTSTISLHTAWANFHEGVNFETCIHDVYHEAHARQEAAYNTVTQEDIISWMNDAFANVFGQEVATSCAKQAWHHVVGTTEDHITHEEVHKLYEYVEHECIQVNVHHVIHALSLWFGHEWEPVQHETSATCVMNQWNDHAYPETVSLAKVIHDGEHLFIQPCVFNNHENLDTTASGSNYSSEDFEDEESYFSEEKGSKEEATIEDFEDSTTGSQTAGYESRSAASSVSNGSQGAAVAGTTGAYESGAAASYDNREATTARASGSRATESYDDNTSRTSGTGSRTVATTGTADAASREVETRSTTGTAAASRDTRKEGHYLRN
jgi:hypothetical protein